MFYGVPPRHLFVNEYDFLSLLAVTYLFYFCRYYEDVYLLEKPQIDEVGVQASILELLTSLISDIKVAIVAGRDVSKVVQQVFRFFFRHRFDFGNCEKQLTFTLL